MKALFPELYDIAVEMDASINSYLETQNDGAHICKTSFVTLVMGSCRQIEWGEGPDQMRWSLNINGKFHVRSYYKALRGSVDIAFPWKSIQCTKAPTRVAIFVWTTAWCKILMEDNLIHRCIIIVDWCCTCKSNGKTVDYLLLHCAVAHELWGSIIRIQSVKPIKVEDILFWWRNWFVEHRRLFFQKIAPLCLMWVVSRERNNWTFNWVVVLIIELKSLLLRFLFR